MNKYLLLTRSNAKKAKSQMITIVALVLIAAMFLNIWLVLTIDYSANFDKRSAELNGEHSLVTFSEASDEFKKICEDTLKSDERVDDYEIINAIYSNTTLKYSVGTIATTTSLISKSDAKSKQIGKYKFLNEEKNLTEDTVFIPHLFNTGGGYNIGDKFEIELQQKKYNFVVGGFFENMITGSMNGGMLAVIVHDKAFVKMQEELSLDSLSISVKLNNSVDDKKFTSSFVEKVSAYRLVPYIAVWQSISKQARTFIGELIGSIIAMVAFLITLIVLIVIAFNISNKVQEDMKSLGVLKGIGYKSNQIILSILLQFLAAALAACIVGIALSYAVLPLLSSLLATQTGIVWQYGFSTISAVITLAIIGVVVSLISFLSAGKIKKITPMTALRDGIETHNFKKNSIPLQKTKLNLHVALGLKSLSKNKKQSISIAIIMSVLTCVAVFAGALYSNVAVDSGMFIKTVMGETSDVSITVEDKYSQEVYTALKGNEGVKKAYKFSSNTVYVNDDGIMGYISDDYSDLNNQMICYDGRFPKHDNEVAVGGYFAKENNLKIGDMVALRFNKPEVKFLITGLTQSSNYMGEDCMLTTSGFSKIGDLLYVTYYANVAENADINKVIASLETQLAEKIFSITNVQEAMAGAAQVYVDMISIIAIAAILIILLVIFLVLYLMVKTFVLKKRKELGILKALGYTTGQLVLQTLLSFLPTVILGVAVGTVLGVFATNPLLTILLSGIGIMKSMFSVSALITVIVSLGIIVFSLGVTFLVSRRIRKITPHKLLMNS